MHVRDDEHSGNAYSETYEFRLKGYVIADMALLCHFTDEKLRPQIMDQVAQCHTLCKGWSKAWLASVLFAVASTTLYVSCGYNHLRLLGSLMSPFHLSAFQPSKVASSKMRRRDFAGAAAV